jgi:heptosyltransferase-2
MSKGARKILVRGVNWLGDAVMTTPALQRLREHFRDAEIALLTPEKLAALYLHHPDIDRVLAFSPGESLVSMTRWLRDEQFDLGVVLPNSPRSALEMFLAGVPRRVGYARPLRSWMLTNAVRDRPGVVTMRKRSAAEVRRLAAAGGHRATFPATAHHVHHYLHLVAALGGDPAPVRPRLEVSTGEVEAMRARLGWGEGGPPVLALNAGAEYGPAKRWPEERFAEAAVELHRATGCRWLVIGGRGDRELAGRIARRIAEVAGADAVQDIAGATTLRELCAALKLSAVLLTNDTGPMHVAAAVGTAVVVPFGSTSPELTGPGLPGGAGHELLLGAAPCAPCFLRECPLAFTCMTTVAVPDVVSAVRRAAQGGRG